MTWHIVCQSLDRNTFSDIDAEHRININLKETASPYYINTNIAQVFNALKAAPSISVQDLLYLAVAVYTADRRVLRTTAYDNWTRDFVIHLPVHEVGLWRQSSSIIEELLSFLTGDRWRIEFRQGEGHLLDLQDVPQDMQATKAAALFSGGLDSFVGTIDLLETENNVALISHHSSGGIENIVQQRVLNLLKAVYPQQIIPTSFFVNPPQKLTGMSELTSRSRSFLYLTLGVAVADAFLGIPLFVPENGYISLNVPLTNNRLGSLSSRTTHPFLLFELAQLLECLNSEVKVNAPFRFSTKGEILLAVKNPVVLHEGIHQTLSCSHTSQQRFRGVSPDNHCGTCLPCLTRRAAFYRAGLMDSPYQRDVLKDPALSDSPDGGDLKALRAALTRWEYSNIPPILQVLRSGPLPGGSQEIQGYIGVFQRGMKEFQVFLNQ